MAVYKRGETWWYSFLFAGRRIQESAKTKSKTLAKRAEAQRRRELEESFNAVGQARAKRVRSVAEACRAYSENYAANHAASSVRWVSQTLEPVKAALGALVVSDVTEDRILAYIGRRRADGIGPRRINMELENLSRALDSTWRILWPGVRKLRQPSDAGRALSEAEESDLKRAIRECESPTAQTIVYFALATGMRGAEIRTLQWRNIEGGGARIAVERSKTEGGTGRRIPLNRDLRAVLDAYRDWFTGRFGEPEPEWYLFPFGANGNLDPTKPIGSIKTAWNTIRERSGVRCRFHDLRHTVATKLAEAGVPESTMIALLGWMSRAMLERYSHVRDQAKQAAVAVLSLHSEPEPQALSTKPSTVEGSERVQ